MRYRISKWSKRLVAELEALRQVLVEYNILYDIKLPHKKYKHKTHDLFCECKKCMPSMALYAKRMKQRR